MPNPNIIRRILLSDTADAFDANAQSFITAAGITNVAQQNAINALVIDLKNNNLWSLMLAIYPFVGASETSHKYNLKNPLDSDAAYRLSFVGGWTHDSNGAKPNGTTGYANTFLLSNSLTVNDFHFSFYNRTNVTEASVDIGANTGITDRMLMYVSYPTDTTIIDAYDTTDTAGRIIVANGGNKGFFIASRESSTIMRAYKNSTNLQNTNLATVGTAPNLKLYIGALNNSGTADSFSTKNCAFATIGSSLQSAVNILALNTAVQTFNTSLSRNV